MMQDSALEIRDISVHFGGVIALDKVCLRLAHGSIHALIGPNGAGKTTLVSVLSGECQADHGHVFMKGQRIDALDILQRARMGLTRTYQLTALFEAMNVRDNLLLSLSARDRPLLKWHDLFFQRHSKHYESEIDAWLDRFALSDQAHMSPDSLSHGDRRRLEIAMALAVRPEVLLLDEPLAGLSSTDALSLVTMIKTTIKGQIPVLLIEHDMDAVFHLADEITVMVNGKVIAQGLPAAIAASDEVQASYLSQEDDF